MPFPQIYLLEGRTEVQKKAVIKKVTRALVEAVGAPKKKESAPRNRPFARRHRRPALA
jgi:4-oxalocrotonate tautomerase family enzyme